MRKCMFCGKEEKDFVGDNCWTEEHIIPEALGNESLKTFDVCKKCNSGLGTYVDNYFVNNFFVKLMRKQLGLKGQSGEIPNPFKEGKDKEGHRIRVDESFKPSSVPYIEQNDNVVRVSANSKEEIKKMLLKKLSRMNVSNDVIDRAMAEVDGAETHLYQPEIRYDFSVDFNRFFLAAIKIGYEYTVEKFGYEYYLLDQRAKELQNYLYSAIKGEMKETCANITYVSLLNPAIYNAIKIAERIHCHMIFIHADCENKLVADIVLFMEKAFSFSMLLSLDASRYIKEREVITEIVDVKISEYTL